MSKWFKPILLVAVVVAVLGSATPAFAESPWWHLASGSRPTYLPSGTAVEEVQEIAFTATSGTVGVDNSGAIAEFAYNATHAEAQVALEGAYGSGNVEVSEPLASGAPFVVTFKGALGYRPVALMNTGLLSKLKNGAVRATAVVTQTREARDSGEVVVTAGNLGDAPVAGEKDPVKITDTLPVGFTAVGISARKKQGAESTSLVCGLEKLTCEWSSVVPSYGSIEVFIPVVISAGASTGEANPNRVSVTGGEAFQCDAVTTQTGKFTDSFCTEEEPAEHGGFERVVTGAAPTASLARPLVLSAQPTPFGLENYELLNEEEGGAPVTQAGAHPFQQTTIVELNQTGLAERNGLPAAEPAALTKDLNFKWPAGLIGNATAVPQCTQSEFLTNVEARENTCPAQTAVGISTVTVNEPKTLGFFTETVPLFNLEPDRGEPARFGFYIPVAEVPVYIDTAVRTGGDYGVTVSSYNITQTTAFLTDHVTVWGVPGDPRHDASRGWGCLIQSGTATRGSSPGALPPCEHSEAAHPPPFLSLPTSCTGPLQSTVEGDSWEELPLESHLLATYAMPALSGCNELPFAPQLEVKPDGTQASKPTGLEVNVHVPQEVNDSDAEGLASSNVKDIEVTLPEGVTLNPAAADGLQACSEAQVGFIGEESGGTDLFTATLPEAFCPDAAKVGTVSIESPLLPKDQPLQGAVYLAAPAPNGEPGQNPFNSLVSMYIVAEDPVSGTLVKLPGKVELNQATGRIESTFENTPQLAFENANIHFFGGERAPLATPAHCGTYTTEASFTPWSGNPPVKSSSSFSITSGPNGTACPGASLPFSPSLAAGMTNINAGAFSPLTTTITREDGQQNISSVQLRFPPGISGILAGVPLCGEAQANAGTCGAASQVGETIVSVGLGGDPYTVTGGKVYITGPYHGAPFGLSIVNPAVAGPFNLGTVVVRGKLEVNPSTAALTFTSNNENEGFAIPHILDGIPLQIKHINVTVNRGGGDGDFTFNPTNCSPMAITGSIGSAEGASSAVQEHFQVTNCASLKFAPKFAVSTKGRTTKKLGASLTAKVTEPAGSMGSQANIARVKVDLPIQLPSQLKTLQKACPAKTFEEGFEQCLKDAPHSKVGEAVVYTPLLPVPLKGPAIFVSHGGEAFPSLTVVLQGYGVTIDLVGATDIKGGITSTTFKTVPDVPFSSFELTIPQGEYAALAVNLPERDHGDLCGQNLKMPTEFLAQNGAKINEDTPISISGCPKAKALTRAQKLQKALKACRQDHNKGKRTKCEAAAHKKYGPVKKGRMRK
jgi:hypothetical protein